MRVSAGIVVVVVGFIIRYSREMLRRSKNTRIWTGKSEKQDDHRKNDRKKQIKVQGESREKVLW